MKYVVHLVLTMVALALLVAVANMVSRSIAHAQENAQHITGVICDAPEQIETILLIPEQGETDPQKAIEKVNEVAKKVVCGYLSVTAIIGKPFQRCYSTGNDHCSR